MPETSTNAPSTTDEFKARANELEAEIDETKAFLRNYAQNCQGDFYEVFRNIDTYLPLADNEPFSEELEAVLAKENNEAGLRYLLNSVLRLLNSYTPDHQEKVLNLALLDIPERKRRYEIEQQREAAIETAFGLISEMDTEQVVKLADELQTA